MKCYAALWQVLMQAEPLELQWLKSLERSLWVEVDKLAHVSLWRKDKWDLY